MNEIIENETRHFLYFQMFNFMEFLREIFVYLRLPFLLTHTQAREKSLPGVLANEFIVGKNRQILII